MDIEKFNPNIAHLRALVEKTSVLTSIDITDKAALAVFAENQKELQQARLLVTKTGKALREESTAFSKAVIAREKELLGVIEPEEERLKQIKEDADHAVLIEQRKGMTPFRIKTMKERGLTEAQFPTNIEELDANEFEAHVSLKVAENNESELTKLREEKDKRDKEYAQKQREQDMKDAAETARLAEIDRQEKEKADAILAEKAQVEKLNKEKAYLEWREQQGWTVATREDYKQETIGGEVVLWKKVGTYKI